MLLVVIIFVARTSASVCADFQSNTDFAGNDLEGVNSVSSAADCCTLCTKNAACNVFTYKTKTSSGNPVCWLKSTANVSRSSKGSTSGKINAHILCETDVDCSLAGECKEGRCKCDGWTHGDHCEVLNLLPVDATRPGYRNSSGFNSWGGASMPFGNKWYLFASQMQGKCALLGKWAIASEVVRSVANDPNGPFVEAEVVVSSFAHNAKPFLAPDGTWLIYYIGETNGAHLNCSENGTATDGLLSPPAYPPGASTAGPIMIASAARPDAPADEWDIHGPFTDSVEWHSATNPSPVFNQNGSVRLAVSRKFANVRPGKRTVLMQADSWRGPYTNITSTETVNGSINSGEDPDLFQTKRGWHMLNHNTGPASTRLWFSEDGISGWTEATGANAFNASVRFTNGTEIVLCQRQRPQIVMAADGVPGWLWTGVMSSITDSTAPTKAPSPGCPQHEEAGPWPTWTLAQQIGRPGIPV
jgi:hypothetical protein